MTIVRYFINQVKVIKWSKPRYSHLPEPIISKYPLCLLVSACIMLTHPVQSYSAEPNYSHLLNLSSDRELARSVADSEFERFSKPLKVIDPLWPVHLFLVAEIQLLRGKEEIALDLYRQITDWALGDPHQDKSGAIGLAAVAHCRLLELMRSQSSTQKIVVTDLVERTRKLIDDRLVKVMFRFGILPALPQVKECIYKNLAHLAWLNGKESLAQDLILNYIRITRADKLDKLTKNILKKAYQNNKATPARVHYYRALTLFSLAEFDAANRLLQFTLAEGEPEIVHKAYLLQARLQRNRGDDEKDVLYTLSQLIDDDPGPAIEQTARFMRANIYKHQVINRNLFRRDLNHIINKFPRGGGVDDALLEIARDHQMAGELREALKYFARIQAYRGHNNSLFSALIQEALTHYAIYRDKNDNANLMKSITIFRKILEQSKTGVLSDLSNFWLGRLHEEAGDKGTAADYFNAVISSKPYRYYGLRAGLHLSYLDSLANRQKSPACQTTVPDKDWLKKLADSISHIDGNKYTLLKSGYHTRLNTAISSGLYKELLQNAEKLRAVSPMKRLEEIEFDALDEGGWIPSLTLLMSFRLDALAAMKKFPRPRNLIKVAALTGNTAQDWELTLSLIAGWESRLINEPGYFKIAYPLLYHDEILRLQNASYEYLPSLLYSVIRRESHFVPSALSKRGAIGLLQFTPRTFDALNRKYDLLDNSKFSTRQEYLLDGKLNIALGGMVFKDMILPKYNGNILYSVMAHNIGDTPVGSWIDAWSKQGLEGDIEYAIETARSRATRIFSRSVLADTIMVQAMGYFNK